MNKHRIKLICSVVAIAASMGIGSVFGAMRQNSVVAQTLYHEAPTAEFTFAEEVSSFFCRHSVVDQYVDAATCTEKGSKTLVCRSCGKVLSQEEIPAIGHNHDYRISHRPDCDHNGVKEDYCTECDHVFIETNIPEKEHDFQHTGTVKATPEADGYEIYKCSHCGAEKHTPIAWVSLGDPELYIPSIELHVPVTRAAWTQEAVDTYDVCVNTSFLGSADEPIILGHNTRSLGILHNTKVGDIIYYTDNGITKVYKVWCSDMARETDGGWNIRTYSNETPCISLYGKEMLHFYTCHNDPYHGKCRWIVLADRIR